MKRMKVLFGQRRMMVLATLAILVLAAAALAASSASFTAQSANPDNVFSTGSLSIGNYLPDGTTSNEGQAIANLSMSNMAPGDSATGRAIIRNTGSVSGLFTLSAANTGGSSAMYDELTCVVLENGAQIYSGSLAALSAQALHGGASWPASDGNTYDITVTLPTASTLQNASTTVAFTWDAVSD